MTDRQLTTIETPEIPTRLEPNAINVAQDTVIGMASSAPAATLAISLAALVAVTSYATLPTLLLTAIPMLIIAYSYHRLNLWQANCGASFEWVGRAINPYLGFMTGWLMIMAYVIGGVGGAEIIGPSVTAIFNTSGSRWTYLAIATGITVVMLIIAVVGIRITARTQVSMALVEYAILVGIAIWGLVAILHHHAGTFPITRQWFSLSGIGGKGSLASGLLVAVFIYSGWEGTLYVNEEVKHRRVNPGRAAIYAVLLLTAIYCVVYLGLSGVVSPAKLQANSASALVYVTQALGGGSWAKVMALSLALSVIALMGTTILLTARIVYGMASHRVLPPFLGNVNRRFATPAAASILVGAVVIVLVWVYLLTSSVQSAFDAVVDVSGLLFASFYVLTPLATIAYYRRRVISSAWDAVVLGILPLAAAGFLVWIIYKSIQSESASQNWALLGIVVVGLLLMLAARFILHSAFFQIPRESAPKTVKGSTPAHRAP
jgi:amino acid transporter